MSAIYDFILSQSTINGCKPRIAKVLIGTGHYGLAWNTKDYYVDIETYEVEKECCITVSKDRKHLNIYTFNELDDPTTNIHLKDVLDDVFKTIKERQ